MAISSMKANITSHLYLGKNKFRKNCIKYVTSATIKGRRWGWPPSSVPQTLYKHEN